MPAGWEAEAPTASSPKAEAPTPPKRLSCWAGGDCGTAGSPAGNGQEDSKTSQQILPLPPLTVPAKISQRGAEHLCKKKEEASPLYGKVTKWICVTRGQVRTNLLHFLHCVLLSAVSQPSLNTSNAASSLCSKAQTLRQRHFSSIVYSDFSNATSDSCFTECK